MQYLLSTPIIKYPNQENHLDCLNYFLATKPARIPDSNEPKLPAIKQFTKTPYSSNFKEALIINNHLNRGKRNSFIPRLITSQQQKSYWTTNNKYTTHPPPSLTSALHSVVVATKQEWKFLFMKNPIVEKISFLPGGNNSIIKLLLMAKNPVARDVEEKWIIDEFSSTHILARPG